MKIGIITFHRALNYGAVLQCYALKEFLRNQGHQVSVIDYKVPKIEESKKVISFGTLMMSRGIKSKVKYLIDTILTFKRRKKAISNFDKFVNEYLNLTQPIVSVAEFVNNYDMIVFGSDQIWNPRICGGFDDVMWGKFNKGDSKFVSYAASVGELNAISQEQWNTIGTNLSKFNFISVREEELKKELIKHIQKPVNVCLDPTLIVPKFIFDSIVELPVRGDYVFLFTVQADRHAVSFAKRIAEKMHCSTVIRCQATPLLKVFWSKNDCDYIDSVSPNLFLGLIKKSKCVVANSFHATALSIVYEKDFYCLDCPKPERMKNILNILHLEDRFVNSTDDIEEINAINYESVNKILVDARKESVNYLKMAGI